VTPLPYSNPAARIAFYAVFVSFVLLEWRVRFRSRRNRDGTPTDQGSLYVVIASVVVGLLGGFALAVKAPGASIAQARWAFFVAGLALMITGVVIRQWAVITLGRFFTVDVRVHSGQTVVERGPYRWVRHPSYTGMILTFVGLGLALGNWASLAVLVVVPTAGLVVRIHYEERALGDGLGEPYRRYAATHARLLPGVW
jgi:protein-S-isoprenylcysteine O-methyltransferase Ste14